MRLAKKQLVLLGSARCSWGEKTSERHLATEVKLIVILWLTMWRTNSQKFRYRNILLVTFKFHIFLDALAALDCWLLTDSLTHCRTPLRLIHQPILPSQGFFNLWKQSEWITIKYYGENLCVLEVYSRRLRGGFATYPPPTVLPKYCQQSSIFSSIWTWSIIIQDEPCSLTRHGFQKALFWGR